MEQGVLFENHVFQIKKWESLHSLPEIHHDKVFLDILTKYSFIDIIIPIPLKKRYSKGRKWSIEEFEVCFEAWKKKQSITLIAANLNRNPQDIIYKLLDRCKTEKIKFTQRDRTISSSNWLGKVKVCAEELFEAGLPAWKIAVLFRVEFEFVEKALFANRKGYGHNKKNPFSINTDHKQLINEQIIRTCEFELKSALEAFAGEGRFTKILQQVQTIERIVCIENDRDTFDLLQQNIVSSKVSVHNKDNRLILGSDEIERFDIVDLDPFITCHEQLETVWNHLSDRSLLFLTFGGEYRRSFIGTNRQSIYNRYSFLNNELSNKEYLEVIPYYFLGYVANKALENGFSFKVLKSVRYANNCRFWLETEKSENPQQWHDSNIERTNSGFKFTGIYIPRFREVRKDIDFANKIL